MNFSKSNCPVYIFLTRRPNRAGWFNCIGLQEQLAEITLHLSISNEIHRNQWLKLRNYRQSVYIIQSGTLLKECLRITDARWISSWPLLLFDWFPDWMAGWLVIGDWKWSQSYGKPSCDVHKNPSNENSTAGQNLVGSCSIWNCIDYSYYHNGVPAMGTGLLPVNG